MKKPEIIEIVETRNSLQEELETLFEEWEKHKNDPLEAQNQEVRFSRIKVIRQQLSQIEMIFRDLAIFDTDKFTTFMTQFLTLTEKTYAKTKLNMQGSFKGVYPTRIIISTPEYKENLENKIHSNKDIEKEFNKPTRDDVIRFNGGKIYPFRKDLKMKNKFAKHQRLKIAIYELMQLRMDHPELTEEESYEIVLNSTVVRNLNRSDQAYFDRKKGSTR